MRALPVLLGLALFWILTRGNVMFSLDSVFYWSGAQTLLDEHALSTGIPYSNNSLDPGLEGHPRPLYPLTVFAPGYSVTTALVAGATGTSIVSAILLVNLFSGAAIILLTGTLARRAAGETAGWVAASLLAVLPFFQRTLANASAELLFVAFMLFALHLLLSWMDAPDHSMFKLYAAILAVTAATYTRYIGISLYLVQVIVAARCLLTTGSIVRRRLHFTLALALYPILMLPLLWRNLSLTGFAGGAARPPADKGIVANLADVATGLVDALPLVRSIAAGPGDAILSTALVAAATVVVLVWRRSRARTTASNTGTTEWVLALSAGVYCTVLVVLASLTGIEDIGVRLLFPPLVCLVVLAAVQMCRLAGRNRQGAVGVVWVALSASISCIEFHPQLDSLTNNSEWNRPLVVWTRENLRHGIGETASIFSDDVYSVHFASGQPIRLLPPVSHLHDLRANSPVDHLIFVIGPATGLSRLVDEIDRNRYVETLDAHAEDVQRGEDFAAWCIPTSRHERASHHDCFR